MSDTQNTPPGTPTTTGDGDAAVTVFYDGSCPLCTREIGFYRQRCGADRIHWFDVSACAAGEVAPDLTREQALSRFHVRDGRGRLVDGGRAFAVLWSALPGFAWAGRVFRHPWAAGLLDRAYDLFLRLRPGLQALLRSRTPGR